LLLSQLQLLKISFNFDRFFLSARISLTLNSFSFQKDLLKKSSTSHFEFRASSFSSSISRAASVSHDNQKKHNNT
jgi:hypothetical protein